LSTALVVIDLHPGSRSSCISNVTAYLFLPFTPTAIEVLKDKVSRPASLQTPPHNGVGLLTYFVSKVGVSGRVVATDSLRVRGINPSDTTGVDVQTPTTVGQHVRCHCALRDRLAKQMDYSH
jgi:hypothetical protein